MAERRPWHVALAALAVLVMVILLLHHSPPMPGACQTPDAEACDGGVARLIEVGGHNPCMVVRVQRSLATRLFTRV